MDHPKPVKAQPEDRRSAAACSRIPLPMDERRLKSVASDISRRYGSDTTEMEKLAMQWAIQEFHRWLVSENADVLARGEIATPTNQKPQ